MSTTPFVMGVSSAPIRNRFPSFYTRTNSKLPKYLYNTPLISLGKGRETERSSITLSATRAKLDDSNSNTNSTTIDRPLANFHPTVWGDHFLSYTPQLTEIKSQEKVEHEKLKENVRRMLTEKTDDSTQKLVLIDKVQRLGVAYHFESEIQTSLQNIFDMSQQKSESDNLYVTALRFRLLRQQRHPISSDVFKRFTNHDGKFDETLTKDVQGLLSLYEASHLRVHGEEILEEALAFSITHLESMLPHLSNSSLKEQVREALRHPVHTNLPRMTARNYICLYEKMDSHNDLLLKFAKLDFNMLQKLYQRELGELTRWWKELDYAKQFPYSRDRLVECHFYTVGIYFEPQHSRARILLTKVLNIYTVIDDTYDAYGTYDELVLFTDAIDRFNGNIGAMDIVPFSLRPAYQALINIYDEIEEALTKEGRLDLLYYAKYEMKKLARAYFKEVQWLNARYTPSCEEYMKNGNVSSSCMMIATTSLVLIMGESTTKETFEWMINEPLILQASCAINRLNGDIVGHNLEQQRNHIASFLECYMKEYGASMEEAYAKAHKEITNAWKDMNKDFLNTLEVPRFVLELVINIARAAYIFTENDFASSQSEFKDKTTLLFVEPLTI